MFKNIGKIVSAILSFALCAAVFSACAAEEEKTVTSELYGTFTYQETLGLNSPLTITNDKEAVITDRKRIKSTVYPIDSAQEGTAVSYNMDARLKLNRDFTYKYDYSLLLSNPGDWGQPFARLTVSVVGTFTFKESDVLGKYGVILGDPTEGTESVYGFTIGGTNIYNWSMHSKPDYVVDIAVAKETLGFKCDRFVKARLVAVDKNDKSLKDDLFDADLLDYICDYSSY